MKYLTFVLAAVWLTSCSQPTKYFFYSDKAQARSEKIMTVNGIPYTCYCQPDFVATSYKWDDVRLVYNTRKKNEIKREKNWAYGFEPSGGTGQ